MLFRAWLAGVMLAGLGLPSTAQAGEVLRSSRMVSVDAQAIFPLEWRRELVRTGTHRTVGFSEGQPCVSTRHRMLVVGTGESKLFGLSADDGGVVWEKSFKAEFDAFCALTTLTDGKEIALVGSRDGAFRAVTVLDGAIVWETAFRGEIRATPVATENGVLVATVANELVLLDYDSGDVIWKEQRPVPSGMTVRGHGRPLVHQGVVYLGFSDGYVGAYTLISGQKLWARPLSINTKRFGDVDASPVVIADTLIVASYSEGVFALSLSSGDTRWRQPYENITKLSLDGGVLLAATGLGTVIRIEPTTGAEKHRTTLPSGPVSDILMERGLAIFGAGENGLVVLEARSGKPLQATALKGEAPSAPSYSSLGLFMLGSRGDIYKFKVPKTGF